MNQLYLKQLEQPYRLRFTFQSTINLMRSLVILVDNNFNKFYQKAKKKDLIVFHNILVTVYNLLIDNPYSLARTQIISYYKIYFSNNSIIGALSGNEQNNHTTIAKASHQEYNLNIQKFYYFLNKKFLN